ncbi:Predicted protein [Anoxybacillus flavithermus WK1]|uniref:Uncharacterized protein n=1 Tax=Anoxybacillus flavithermus (strain DSM 21510 / WK1) TaxID=491915 RepID=B7GJT6_ANOFW|nr:Predicted protein [Anoxybacillus flavithermus WK1]
MQIKGESLFGNDTIVRIFSVGADGAFFSHFVCH